MPSYLGQDDAVFDAASNKLEGSSNLREKVSGGIV